MIFLSSVTKIKFLDKKNVYDLTMIKKILSDISHKRKNIFFMRKVQQLRTIINLTIVLVTEFFLIAVSHQFLQKALILINHGLFFGEKNPFNSDFLNCLDVIVRKRSIAKENVQINISL